MQGVIDWLWHQRLGRPYWLNYVQYGTGQRPLLLLHGLASSHEVWKPLMKLVGGEWSITAPDLLGFGGSPAPGWGVYDVDQHTKHISALLRRFHV
jgi:pimeloyl-ACP methyl ester carboxylesterase